MENIDRDLIIKSIVAVPRSKNFYNFYINGTSEKRSMKLEALADFITKLCPEVGGRARIMIYEFRPFYVEIETKSILELLEKVKDKEPERLILFGTTRKRVKEGREEKKKKESPVDKRRQTIFGNILRLVRNKS